MILGLLSDSPKYGYEIEKIIEEQSIRDWVEIGFSSIYYILSGLERKQMVSSTLKNSDKNRTRKIYTITDLGKTSLQNQIREKLKKVNLVKWQIDIGLAYLEILPSVEVKSLLKDYKKSLEETVKGYGELKKYLTKSECPLNRIQLAERPIHLYQAEIKWVDEFLKELNKIEG